MSSMIYFKAGSCDLKLLSDFAPVSQLVVFLGLWSLSLVYWTFRAQKSRKYPTCQSQTLVDPWTAWDLLLISYSLVLSPQHRQQFLYCRRMYLCSWRVLLACSMMIGQSLASTARARRFLATCDQMLACHVGFVRIVWLMWPSSLLGELSRAKADR